MKHGAFKLGLKIWVGVLPQKKVRGWMVLVENIVKATAVEKDRYEHMCGSEEWMG